MEQFPHLKFAYKLEGKPRFIGGGGENVISKRNKENRREHGNFLFEKTSRLKTDWAEYIEDRGEELATIDGEVQPIYVQLNPDLFSNPEFNLANFNIEIISELDDGYIIGASLDNLRSLERKIEDFQRAKWGSAKIADLWRIIDGNRNVWKPQYILSEELYAKWSEIDDDQIYQVEVGIAFDKPLGKEPDPTKQGGEKRLEEYRQKQQERDELLFERHNNFDEFIHYYGERTSDFVDLVDSFSCKIRINGKGLKDLVNNYQFVFEVNELDDVRSLTGTDSQGRELDLEVLPPEQDAPKVGVIDSGIMEEHKFIQPAIDSGHSRSYVVRDDSTADHVQNGGHGTRVAGAILYPNGISNINGHYQLPCFIRNLRVLNRENHLNHRYPAQLMVEVVEGNQDCPLFNLSIASDRKYRLMHMSTWAAIIDKLTHEKNILFTISAGNISRKVINHYIRTGYGYPGYLFQNHCKIANPGQSCFSITVGSVNHALFENEDWASLGNEDDVSAFSRTGLGIWGSIKPDVVEYGGGYVASNNEEKRVKANSETAPELLRSTLNGGAGVSRDAVGTSFSTPKVTHVLAVLKKLYPDENVNLLRALLVQGARLPNHHFRSPSKQSIQFFGYGLPSIDRVTKNSEYRITLYNTGYIKAEQAHVYSLKIPEELRRPDNDFEMLIEITLSFTAKVRRTRQRIKSYLSTWVDWETAKNGEPHDEFKQYILKELKGDKTEYSSDRRKQWEHFKWQINNNVNYGSVEDTNRTNSSVQKDWAFLKSYELPEEISLAVRGHKGWDRNHEEVPYAISVSVEVLGQNIPIYEEIKVENETEIET